jgi:predicted nuclease of restriction endonuclease-like (RecB) superfamily
MLPALDVLRVSGPPVCSSAGTADGLPVELLARRRCRGQMSDVQMRLLLGGVAVTDDRDKSHRAPAHAEEMLFDRVSEILDAARTFVSRSVNTTMVQAYWLIARNIVEVEQAGATRAEYGEAVVKRLSNRLVQRYGRGFSYPSIKRMKQFYLAYPQGSALPKPPTQRTLADAASAGEEKGSSPPSLLGDVKIGAALLSLFPAPLGWTHYTLLMKVKDPSARAFYEIESAREGWTTRDLERQIASLLYERLARSRAKEGVLALAREGQQVTTPASVLKDPFVLEFLDLAARPQWRERDLEQAIIDRLESFLLELGKGFCFVARQNRLNLH